MVIPPGPEDRHSVGRLRCHIQQTVFPRLLPYRNQAANDNTGIEKIRQITAIGCRRWKFIGKNAKRFVPRFTHKEVGRPAGRIQVFGVLRRSVEEYESLRRIRRNLRRNGKIFRYLRAIEAGEAAGGFLNTRVKEPVSGPGQRVCRQGPILSFVNERSPNRPDFFKRPVNQNRLTVNPVPPHKTPAAAVTR
jgi:hypothetical protein